MSKTSGSWQWPCSDISQLPSILGCLSTAPTDSAALKYNLLLLWHPTALLVRLGCGRCQWKSCHGDPSPPSVKIQLLQGAKTNALQQNHGTWKPVQNEAHLAGSGRRNLHLNKPGLIQNLLKSMEKLTGFKGETPETPTWDFIGVSDWAHQTRELWFSGCPKTCVRD